MACARICTVPFRIVSFSWYCDICNAINALNDLEPSRAGGRPEAAKELLRQFRGLECPDAPGFYRLQRRFCMDDWRVFDQDGDCRLDFVGDRDGNLDEYASAWRAIKQIGFVSAHNRLVLVLRVGQFVVA